jgi:hypothetical protein
MKLVEGSLEFSGDIVANVPYSTAEIMFSPGPRACLANLAAGRSLSFRVKGDGNTYQLMIFTHTVARIPVMFVRGRPGSREVQVPA